MTLNGPQGFTQSVCKQNGRLWLGEAALTPGGQHVLGLVALQGRAEAGESGSEQGATQVARLPASNKLVRRPAVSVSVHTQLKTGQPQQGLAGAAALRPPRQR